MKILIAFLLCFATFSLCAETNVVSLSDENFLDTIEQNEYVLVKFFAPWCHHCKELAPKYEKAAEMMKDEAVVFGEVDCDVAKELCSQNNIRGYPSLFLYVKGEPMMFTAGREPEAIVKWLMKMTVTPAQYIETSQEMDSLLDSAEHAVFVTYLEKGSPEVDDLFALSREYSDVDFVFTDDNNVLKKLNEDKEMSTGTSFMYQDETEWYIYEGDFKKEKLMDFVLEHRYPLVMEFSVENMRRVTEGPYREFVFLILGMKSETGPNTLAEFKEAAKVHRADLLYMYVDTDTELGPGLATVFGASDEHPTVRIFAEGKKYGTSEEYDKDYVVKLVEEYLEGKAPQFLLSDPIPEDWDAKPVKVLVGENFKDAVNSKKYSFVKFYSPQCSHCLSMVDAWIELAEKYSDSEELMIAEINGVSNEIEGVELKKFPTMLLFKGETYEISEFNGDRTVDDFVEFLEAFIGGKDVEEKEPVVEDTMPTTDEL